ncbi:MAG: DNA replication/repair protein RecF [Geobacteraceae bacterium]|nr:DNA replication/repair protein RecF [Geobacteraceae bacterium]
MLLKKLTINKFRNIERSVVEFDRKFNIFYGQNGQGKTNFLESIFFLATLKSFRNSKQKEMLKWNENSCLLNCTIHDGNIGHELSVLFENNTKQLKIDDKSASRIIDYCKTFTVVAFCPEELIMINGAPDQRRRYLDRAVFSSQPEYLKTYHDYYRILKQRNHLLKQRSYIDLDAWTEQLAKSGAKLIFERSNYLAKLSEGFASFYKNISGSDEEAGLCYHNSSYRDSFAQNEIQAQLLGEIALSCRIEKERGTTVVGPHRDDIEFYLNKRLIREHGSQGQQKSFVMALKMAEIDYLGNMSGNVPVLLLDDMTAELDSSRIDHLMNFLVQRDMQVFITTTDKDSVPLPKGRECSTFLVENGRIV